VLGAPLIWLVVVYLGSLAALLLTSLWTQDSFTAEVVRIWTLDNFTSVLTGTALPRGACCAPCSSPPQ
jgi:putative spermidine/putrescine transport system permease protein